MEQDLYLKTKKKTDYIATTTDLLHTIKNNTYMIYPGNVYKPITAKQHDFMTFILRGLHIMVNTLFAEELQDLTLKEKTQYIQENSPFFKINVDDILPFLQRTSTGSFRNISKQDGLQYVEQLRQMSNTLALYRIIDNEDGTGQIQSINLFSFTSLDYKEVNGQLIDILSFDLYINPQAVESILIIFDTWFGNKGFGKTYIDVLLNLRSVHSKNLYYFISRYANLIGREQGHTINLSTITKYLGIDKQTRPYNKLMQIVQQFNKDIKDTGSELVITITKKGKAGQVKQINLKMDNNEVEELIQPAEQEAQQVDYNDYF